VNKVQKCSKELHRAMVTGGMIDAPSSCTVDSIVGLKALVSAILHEALRGYDVSKRYRNEDGYVRWGLVEKDIHAAIDEANSGIGGK
jgi:hypothetical protein